MAREELDDVEREYLRLMDLAYDPDEAQWLAVGLREYRKYYKFGP